MMDIIKSSRGEQAKERNIKAQLCADEIEN